MSTLALTAHQAAYDRKRFLRDPAGLFYALGLPGVFLITFLATLGGNEEIAHIAGHTVGSKPYYLAGIVTMAVVSVTFVNLVVSLVTARERGTLKRLRGTPLPLGSFLAARVATALTVTAASVLLVAGVGWAAYGVTPPGETLPGALLALLVAAFAFCCLAFALAAVLPTANAAAAVTMTLTLVLYFLSAVFTREDNIPQTLRTVAGVFPVKRLFEAMVIAYDPATTGPAFSWSDIAVLAAWGLGALAVALRHFRWTPAGG